MRIKFLFYLFVITLAAIAARLFYWQIIDGDTLARAAALERNETQTIPAARGTIYASDGHILAGNEPGYLLYASTNSIKATPTEIAHDLAPIISSAESDNLAALTIVPNQTLPTVDERQIELDLKSKLSGEPSYYVPLAHDLTQKYVDEIKKLNVFGLGFDPEPIRMYPEGSMASTTLGFVGSDSNGDPEGFFGLEGYYNSELSGRSGIEKLEKDAAGRPIPIGVYDILPASPGRSLVTTIDRYVQFILERDLRDGVAAYQADSGTAAIMDPKTGAILASATWPDFDPRGFSLFDKSTYTDGLTGATYEPGSTSKIMTMAAGLDLGLIKPDTVCPICDKPLELQGNYVRTWNNQYFAPGTENMTTVMEHSDNVGAAWVAGLVGRDRFYDFAKKLGIGDKTGIDLQGEETGVFYPSANVIQPLDLATMGFGQGYSTSALKILQIAAMVANQGIMMQPHFVKEIKDTNRTIEVTPQSLGQLIKPATAEELNGMMVAVAKFGEAHRLIPEEYHIAGKTGTAQVPIAGHYSPNETIASFVGFAPAENPKFAMIVKYVNPKLNQGSAALTAVPTWVDIARDLFVYFGLATSP